MNRLRTNAASTTKGLTFRLGAGAHTVSEDAAEKRIAADTKNSQWAGMYCIFDFMQMGKENEPGRTLAILVVKERRTRMLMATVVPSKTLVDSSPKECVPSCKNWGSINVTSSRSRTKSPQSRS